jgi:hypothetical protein
MDGSEDVTGPVTGLETGSETGSAHARARPRLAFTVSFVADGARLQGGSGKPIEDDAVDDEGEEEGEEEEEGGVLGGKVENQGGAGAADDHELASDEVEGEASPYAMEDEDKSSYEAWLGDLEPGAVADHPLLPIVWDDGDIAFTKK